MNKRAFSIATAVSAGFPTRVTRKDDDWYPLLVANSYLGEHRTFNGVLMNELRGKRGLNYGDYSYIRTTGSYQRYRLGAAIVRPMMPS